MRCQERQRRRVPRGERRGPLAREVSALQATLLEKLRGGDAGRRRRRLRDRREAAGGGVRPGHGRRGRARSRPRRSRPSKRSPASIAPATCAAASTSWSRPTAATATPSGSSSSTSAARRPATATAAGRRRRCGWSRPPSATASASSMRPSGWRRIALCVLAPSQDTVGGVQMSERLLRVLQGLEAAGGLPIGISAGVAACPEHGSDAEQLLHKADEAMWRARALGQPVGVGRLARSLTDSENSSITCVNLADRWETPTRRRTLLSRQQCPLLDQN